MPTNLEIDDELLEDARRLGKHRTKQAAVNAALEEYVHRRRQLGILDLFGTIDYYETYDDKAERGRKRSW